MKYEIVVNEIGGGNISETARRLGIPYATVAQWRNGKKVPHWREDHIRRVAARMGVSVDVEKEMTERAARKETAR